MFNYKPEAACGNATKRAGLLCFSWPYWATTQLIAPELRGDFVSRARILHL